MNDDSKLDVWSHIETFAPRNRLVLLGASNLTRAFPTAVRQALTSFDRPLSVYAAMGLGRSYGKESHFFGKKISGIFQCGIWDALQQKKRIPTTAFVTDIGNDLAYEVPVDRVVEWVDRCVERLQTLDARVVIADLPVEVLRSVGASRFRFFRALFFPQCQLDLSELLRRAELLNERLQKLAKTRNTPIFSVPSQWYGWDPIHPKRAALSQLWRELFATIGSVPNELSTTEKSVAFSWYLRGLRPEKWSTFSISRRAAQPQGRLCDGTVVSLY